MGLALRKVDIGLLPYTHVCQIYTQDFIVPLGHLKILTGRRVTVYIILLMVRICIIIEVFWQEAEIFDLNLQPV